MKEDQRNLTFLKFSDSNFSHPGLCSKPNGDIVNFDSQLLVLENTDHSKPPNSLVITDDKFIFFGNFVKQNDMDHDQLTYVEIMPIPLRSIQFFFFRNTHVFPIFKNSDSTHFQDKECLQSVC